MNISLARLLLLILLIGVGAVAATADTSEAFNLTFTFTEGGLTPTAGTFTYDTTSNTFTTFTVVWDSLSFDLRSSANAPGLGSETACANTPPASASALFEALIDPTGACGGFDFWLTGASGGQAFIAIGAQSPVPGLGQEGLQANGMLPFAGAPLPAGGGYFTVTRVPEPTSGFLIIVCGSLLIAAPSVRFLRTSSRRGAIRSRGRT